MASTLSRGERVRAGVASVAVVGVLGWALLAGLRLGQGVPVADALSVFSVVPPPARERVVPKRVPSRRAAGEAAPPNRVASPKPVTAPVPIVPPPIPPQVLAPTVASVGAQAEAGAAPRPGPGTGAGGEGNGLGAGGDGDGTGSGWDDETPPRRLRGRIRDSDYPEAAADAGAGGTVSVRYHVEVDGRVTECRVTGSSGNPVLDATTCRLIEERFRYAPSRDAAGRPVRSTVVVDHDWVLEREPAARR